MNKSVFDLALCVGDGEDRSKSANSISRHLGAWGARLSLEEIPDDVRQIAKRCLIDTIAVSAAGGMMPVARSMRAHVLAVYGPGECTLIEGVSGISILGAALANGVAAHALDFDDTSYAGVVHSSAVVLPAVLAAAEHADLSGADFLAAFIAGSEVIYSIGLTLSDNHYLNGWWATSTLGAIGAATGAARALGLGQEKTAHAIALAAVQANGMCVLFGSDAKPVIAGQAARLGLEAALLSNKGISAPPTVFEDPRGFLKLMNDGIHIGAGLNELGRTWRLLDPGVAFKRAPVCSAAQAALEALEQLIRSHRLDGSQIKAVTCHVSHLVKISLVHEQPVTPSQAQFSMPFAIACILLFGSLRPEHINRKTLSNKDLQAAMNKVNMIEDTELNGPEFQPHFPECARVTVTMSDGKTFTRFIGAATGMPGNPLSTDALLDKLRACTAYAGWSDNRTNKVLDNLENIKELSSIRSLLKGGI
ncbi:MAG: MmgE/PrpD family protein [bacterium]|nr:MmgE/PrpD family protein [bacterium]